MDVHTFIVNAKRKQDVCTEQSNVMMSLLPCGDNLLETLNKISTNGISPDIVILLDLEPEKGIKRALYREENLDNARFELENIEFHKKVREGYLKLANEKKWLICDATLSPEKINNRIVNYLENDRNFKNFIKKQ